MKQLLLAACLLATVSLRAQNNIFLDQSFWRSNPDLATIRAEIAKGNNPSESNRMGFDPVVYAINTQASDDVIKFLLEQKGNDANKLTHDARTYIFWAASKGNVEIVNYLISKGAKVNVEDTHDMTPIRFAAAAGQNNAKLYDALIAAGSDVKQKNKDGASLLLIGIAGDKDLALTNYLISKGLSLKDVDAGGNTAFNYAARSGNIPLMKTLLEKGVKYTDNAMIMAAQGGGRGGANNIEVFRYLESLNIKPNAVSAGGENALHSIVRKPAQAELIRYFLSKGVDVNKADNEGNTPFMNAANANRDTAVINLLLANVKNINQGNKKNITALAMAVKNNSPAVVQLLIDKGANVNVSDAEGNNLAYYLIQSYSNQSQGMGGPDGQGRPGGAAANAAANPFDVKLKILQQNGLIVTTPQKDGSTLYHLAVVKNDISLLSRIEKLGINVNAKNNEGLTPLHRAAMIAKDDSLMKYLLSIGAQKDPKTEFKETAFDLAKENEYLTKTNVSVDFLKP